MVDMPEKVRIDIANAIDGVINISNIPETVEVIRNVPKGEFFVTIDVKQISMVFKNILINASQAMNNKGIIWITTDRVSEKWVEVSFKDSGHGIEQENLKKIFQPFFGTKTTGYGFGLTLSQIIMENHGGKMIAQSELGKGATFTTRLSLAESN